METKSLAYTESLNLKWFILNSTNHKMRSFITSRERKLFMQLHKALCKLLWVSHKARVTHSQEQVQRGTGGQTGAQGTAGREVLRFPCLCNGASSVVSTLKRDFYHRHQGWKCSDQGRVILLTWSFLWITESREMDLMLFKHQNSCLINVPLTS